jgi:dethiobiotin synthetase/adenosylmethionine--8-amino-7-oxononanoate aminotransferase
MAHLPTRSFQAYQVFAANTNVGKTILSTGLVRAAAALSVGAEKQKRAATKAFYLKPVQTGYPVDCDARYIRRFFCTLSEEWKGVASGMRMGGSECHKKADH